jgi:hypothetical protein
MLTYAGEFSESGLPVLTTIEKAFLKELLGDAAQASASYTSSLRPHALVA